MRDQPSFDRRTAMGPKIILSGVRSTLSGHWSWLLFYPLIFLNGTVVLLKSARYPLLSAEVAVAFLLLTALGILIGFCAIWTNKHIQNASAACFSTLLVILISRPFPVLDGLPSGTLPWALAIFTVLFLAMSLLGENLSSYLTTIAFVTFLSAFLTAPSHLQWETTQNELKIKDDQLPPYIHIVLDESIGIEGILKDYGTKTSLPSTLANEYVSLGFRVYSRAFSRYKTTRNSFASFLNFSPGIEGILDENGDLKRNELFEQLIDRGYSLNVFQPSLHNLCNQPKMAPRIASCLSYPFAPTLEGLIHSDLKETDKAIIIVNTFFDRTSLPSVVDQLAGSTLGEKFSLPGWPIRSCISCIASKTVLSKLDEKLKSIEPGDAYFVHLLLPHAPYENYSDDCKVTYLPLLDGESFDRRYSRYLKQLQCTQRMTAKVLKTVLSKEHLKYSTIVVHGDHGTRVYKSRSGPYGPATEKGVQAYSTFFALRKFGLSSGRNRTPLPLDVLLRETLGSHNPPAETLIVYYPGGIMKMPPFSYGEMTQSW